MAKQKPEPVTLVCPVCGASASAETKYKGWQLWYRWMSAISDIAAKAIKYDDRVPPQLRP